LAPPFVSRQKRGKKIYEWYKRPPNEERITKIVTEQTADGKKVKKNMIKEVKTNK